jgi:hypothetical protein
MTTEINLQGRYLAFSFMPGEEAGGMDTCIGAFDDVEAMLSALRESVWNDHHVFDTRDRIILYGIHEIQSNLGGGQPCKLK